MRRAAPHERTAGKLSARRPAAHLNHGPIDLILEAFGDETEVRFTHVGLVPDDQCYDACSDGWGTYINGSLKDLIVVGKGHPNVGEAITGSEQSLAASQITP